MNKAAPLQANAGAAPGAPAVVAPVSAGLLLAATILQGQQHLDAGRVGEAKALAELVLGEHPDHGRALHLLGRSLLAEGQPQAARDVLLRALKTHARSADLYVDLAAALQAGGDLRAAIVCISRAAALLPSGPSVAAAAAKLWLQLGDSRTAEQQLRRAIVLDFKQPALRLLFGQFLGRTGRMREAIVELMRATVVAPYDIDAHVSLSLTLREAGYPSRVYAQPMRTAARLRPDLPNLARIASEFCGPYGLKTAMAYAKVAHQAFDAQAERDPVGQHGVRIIYENTMPVRIGELLHQMEVYVKSGLLGWRKPIHGILLCDMRETPYPNLFDYWRRYVPIVSEPELIERLTPLRMRLMFDPVSIILPDGKAHTRHRALLAIQEEWERQGRGPLLELTGEHRAQGRATLARLGMPEGAWHVVVHARAASTFQEGPDHGERTRNADIETFLPAIEEIVRRGGWVIRLGEPSMKPLPPLRQVIDYAHSEVRGDVMDIYCCATARFLLGSPSGLSMLPHAFGVPVALSNFYPGGDRPWSSHDLFVPKLYRRVSDGALLGFDEMTTLPLALTYNANVVAAKGLTVVDSTAEEILELAIEMLDRREGGVSYTEEENQRQARYDNLMNRIAPGWVRNRVGRAFLARYSKLL